MTRSNSARRCCRSMADISPRETDAEPLIPPGWDGRRNPKGSIDRSPTCKLIEGKPIEHHPMGASGFAGGGFFRPWLDLSLPASGHGGADETDPARIPRFYWRGRSFG